MASEIAGYTAVTAALWRQREAMQRLAGALAGRGALPDAIEDVRFGEILRMAESQELAAQLGLPGDAGLTEIALVSAEPWQSILLDHVAALRRLYTEVTGLAAVNGHRFWQESLDDLLS
jgi:hypothetical protein